MHPTLDYGLPEWCNPSVAFGWVLVGIGAVGMVWPRVFVSVAPYYRAMMPREASPTALWSARIGGLIVAAAGLAVALAA